MKQSAAEPDVPAWFARAVAARPQRHVVDVSGVEIHYRTWEGAGRPPLVLVHAAGAHSGWWDHIAPLLSPHRVVALDLSGHGDSGHQRAYDMAGWGREILAVMAVEHVHRPVVVGHSMGGRAAVTTAVEHPGTVAAVVCVDTPLTRRRPDGVDARKVVRTPRVYSTAEDAVARFRTRPQLEAPCPPVLDHIARQSLRPVDGGWTWKGDEGVFGRGQRMQDLLPRLRCPLAMVRGEHGLVPTAMASDMSELVTDPMPVIELPDAGHHPMLDRPLTLVAALRALLAVWPELPRPHRHASPSLS